MSGHSKWAQIKRQKGAADAKRGTLYTKLSQAIAAAADEGGNDPEKNVRLRLAIDKARAANMPNATIERALTRGSGSNEGRALETVLYEAFGTNGAGLLIETKTDNKNRTAAAIRHTLASHGVTLAGTGSVQWKFRREGNTFIPHTPPTELDATTQRLINDLRALSDVTNIFAG